MPEKSMLIDLLRLFLLCNQGEAVLADWGICGRVMSAEEIAAASDAIVTSQSVPSAAAAKAAAPAAEGRRVGQDNNIGDEDVSASTPTKAEVLVRQQSASSAASSLSISRKASSLLPPTPAGLFAPGAPMGTPFWAAPELDLGLPHDQ